MSGKKYRILVADAKDFLRDVIVESLGKETECVCVSTPEELCAKIGNVDAAVVGTNIWVDDLTIRYEAIAKLRQITTVPLLVLTSKHYSSVRIGLLKSGADDVMTKPFNPDEMAIRVRKLINRFG